jgi:antitoxin CptB
MKSEADTIEDTGNRRKRLIYRSWHRGMREMDLIMGDFADQYVPGFSEAELGQYEEILNLSDPDLYNWITGVEEAPANLVNGVFERLLVFRPKLS